MRSPAFLLTTCSALTLSATYPCWGQEGYSLEPGRVVVDSREHWELWNSAANTVQISDEGVRPGFIRKHTRLEIDGGEVVVPGINAVFNAVEFEGGVLNAGSNRSSAIDVMDGRMDTYWEPDASDLLQDWWLQIDLGRTVSATRIVLKFVDESLGDPFLQFRVTTSQGQETPAGNQLLFRTRFTTEKPNKSQRVIEIDLTKQLPTQWPDARGDFTGDVIRYVGVGITDSDLGRGRQVSQSEYDSLPTNEQGEIDYFRQEVSGRVRLLDGKEDWDALTAERQGPVVYYRREIPRLAEVEVWTIGDNIGTGVLQRGGRVTAGENNNRAGAVVDGDLYGQAWSALGSFDPNRLAISDPRDAERSMFIDLGGSYFVDHIRILHAVSNPPPFRAYRIQLSDGSTNAGGELAWRTVGSLKDVSREQTFHGFEFPLTKTAHMAFTYLLQDRETYEAGQGSHGVSEVQLFGEGYLAESQISSEFGGEAPFIEVARTPQNLAFIEWEADEPPGTDLILQTRTGDTVESVTRYLKKNGSEFPGTEEEALEAWEDEKKFFGDDAVGPAITETNPGSDWSGWSQPYFDSGERITSPSPRRYVAVRATFLTEDPLAAATLRSVALNFVRPVVRAATGEVLPSRLEDIGTTQQFSYFVRSSFRSDSRGFDEILIEAPDGVDMKLNQVNVDVDGQDAVTYTPQSEGFEVVMDETDSLWVRLPAPVRTTRGSALVELQFETTVFVYNTFFIGSLGHSQFENSWQRVDDGDANRVVDSETTVVLALERGELLGDLQVDNVFTPNGDGANDELEVSFSLLRLTAAVPVALEIYDLSGRLVTRMTEETTAGRHTVAWTGMDQSGAIVPPGIYLMRLDVDVDWTSGSTTSFHRLVHVVY